MKEIQNVVQKLSCEQESAAGGGGVRTNRYKNIKSPLVYRGDLMMASNCSHPDNQIEPIVSPVAPFTNMFDFNPSMDK